MKNIKFYFNGKEISFEKLSEIPQRTTDRENHTRTKIVLMRSIMKKCKFYSDLTIQNIENQLRGFTEAVNKLKEILGE